MALIKWDPFRDTFMTPWEEVFGKFSEIDMRSVSTPVDMYETDDSVVVKMDMPGVKSEEVDISVKGDTLTVRAESEEEKKKEDKKRKYYMRQMRKRQYATSVSLPAMVDIEKTEAEMKDGVLTITLPKTEEAKPKMIKVKAK